MLSKISSDRSKLNDHARFSTCSKTDMPVEVPRVDNETTCEPTVLPSSCSMSEWKQNIFKTSKSNVVQYRSQNTNVHVLDDSVKKHIKGHDDAITDLPELQWKANEQEDDHMKKKKYSLSQQSPIVKWPCKDDSFESSKPDARVSISTVRCAILKRTGTTLTMNLLLMLLLVRL